MRADVIAAGGARLLARWFLRERLVVIIRLRLVHHATVPVGPLLPEMRAGDDAVLHECDLVPMPLDGCVNRPCNCRGRGSTSSQASHRDRDDAKPEPTSTTSAKELSELKKGRLAHLDGLCPRHLSHRGANQLLVDREAGVEFAGGSRGIQCRALLLLNLL